MVGRKQQRTELNLTLNAEMLHGQMVDFHNNIKIFARHRIKQCCWKRGSNVPKHRQLVGKDLSRHKHK